MTSASKTAENREKQNLQVKELDFRNTKVAFAHKSDSELKKMYRLFTLMNYPWLVSLGSYLMLWAIKLRLPFVEWLIKNTIFHQFCGGRTLLECKPNITNLYEHGAFAMLDYGVEAKQTDEAFNYSMNENVRAIEFAALDPGIPAISIKITGIGKFSLLEEIHAGKPFTKETRVAYKSIVKRLDAICKKASERNVKVLIDAEETWIQSPLDHLATMMMRRYNRGKVVVYNTFQMYRTDRLQFLIDAFNLAQKGGYMLGAKLVRGAYMEKERRRAAEKGYPSPIHPNKQAVDDAYNTAVKFCMDNIERLAMCNATHNEQSIRLQASLMVQKGLAKNHPHTIFCQLWGMSDHLTFNLAETGFNVAKLIPYGPVKEVIPYLIRRAEENTAVTGDVNREYAMITTEMKRRGLKK